jgi:hypothetical protein
MNCGQPNAARLQHFELSLVAVASYRHLGRRRCHRYSGEGERRMKMKRYLIAALLFSAAPVFAESGGADAGGGVTVNLKGITATFGGFAEGTMIYRSRNLNSDVASPYQAIPLKNAPGYYQDETRFSARHSRLSLLVKGDYSDDTHVSGYYEMDFLGAAATANSNESNSYNPRLRHAYAAIDWDTPGLHVLAGQTWSLLTLDEEGMALRKEAIPLTIDVQYVPGFSWARQPQFRLVKDWQKKYWLGLSVENAQTTVRGGPNTPLSPNYANSQPAGAGFAVPVSVNSYPDFIIKVAADPGWGHYELYDLIRVFENGLPHNGTVRTTHTVANAVGGGFILPVIPKQLKLYFSGMYGDGVGRYGTTQFPDVTQRETGENEAITGWHLFAGLVWDPTGDWTFYTYAGQEQSERKSWLDLLTGKSYGYGSQFYDNSGASHLGGNITGNLQRVSQATVGTWWKFYQGKIGKMQAGVQYSYTEDMYFRVINGGAPRTNDNMVFTNLRYNWQ